MSDAVVVPWYNLVAQVLGELIPLFLEVREHDKVCRTVRLPRFSFETFQEEVASMRQFQPFSQKGQITLQWLR
jgi:hypothetical protein